MAMVETGVLHGGPPPPAPTPATARIAERSTTQHASISGAIHKATNTQAPGPLKKIKIYPSPPSAKKLCAEPITAFETSQIKKLDPTGSRTRLFSKDNLDSVRVGDILLVRSKDGEPFAGVLINLRRRGIDTGILLRNQLTRVGVEMWFKIYSSNVEGIEIVQRRVKRARRARLYYMRKVKHDLGSVEGTVRMYLRSKAALGTGKGTGAGGGRGRDANAGKKGSQNKKGKK